MQQRFHKLIFEVAARLAQTRALAEHAADAEAMTDERIQRDAPGGNVAASFAWPQGDSQAVAQRLEHLGFDEGQRTAGARRPGEVSPSGCIAVPFEPDPRNYTDSVDRPHWFAFAPCNMDGLDETGLCLIRHSRPQYHVTSQDGVRP